LLSSIGIMTTRKPVPMLLASLALAATTASAATLTTPPLQPDPDGRLVCTVVNATRRSFDMRAAIVGPTGEIVTDFVSTAWSNDGRLVEVVAESSSDVASVCVVEIGTNRKSSVRAILEAFDADGVRTAVVEAR
jgi:hypothetical protein